MEEEKKPKLNNSTKLIVSIILIVIGVTLITWFLCTVFTGNETVSNMEATNISQESAEEAENTNAATVEENEATASEAKTRDDQRIAGVEELRAKLKMYFDDKGNYPETMDELVNEGYLTELPQNPTPGGIDYVYTPIGSLPAKYYDLAYSLEVGANDMEAGEHVANPDYIAYP